MVYVIPHSGLANRMRVIVSGLAFAAHYRQRLTVVWRKDGSLNCNFHQLFEVNGQFEVTSNNVLYRFIQKAQYSPRLKNWINPFLRIGFSLSDQDFTEYVWKYGHNFINHNLVPSDARNYLFSTCHDFMLDSKFLQYLSPVQPIREAIELVCRNFSENTVGVHIRRTDHQEAIAYSPLALFVESMQQELEADANVLFFLATDDSNVEEEIKKIFTDRVITYQKERSRLSTRGIQDALVDLHCLARTRKIYGSYFSSFSEVAALVGNVPLSIRTKQLS